MTERSGNSNEDERDREETKEIYNCPLYVTSRKNRLPFD